MEKRERIFIILATSIILLSIFVAFIISNSQKVPPEVLVQNEEQKIVSALMGGYTWKVFGTNIIADSVDLKSLDYSSANTIVSKTGDMLTISTTEKFSVQSLECVEFNSDNLMETPIKNNETGNYFTINVPEIEGAYLCKFSLNYFSKGSAEYAVKIVVTDENIYEVNDIIDYKNTEILNVENVKAILNRLPYSVKIIGIIIDEAVKSIKIKYNDTSIMKEDVLNNTIALFALVPEVENIIYEVNSLKDDIYYTRSEVNNLIGRDVIEYIENTELWIKEIIYKEQMNEYNKGIEIFTSAISTSLSNLKQNEIGKYIAIDVLENNHSGDIKLDEFDVKELLDELSLEYNTILNVNKDEFVNSDGTLVIAEISPKFEEGYIVKIVIKNQNNELQYIYRANIDGEKVTIEKYDLESNILETEEDIIQTSGEEE